MSSFPIEISTKDHNQVCVIRGAYIGPNVSGNSNASGEDE